MTEDGFKLKYWLSVVRRARLGRTTKAVAFAVALYANPDGTKVYPGIARLSVECELGTKVIKGALRALREAGLIELVKAGTRSGDSNEYRLILAEDLVERIDVPSPAAHSLAINRAADSIRGRYRDAKHDDPDPPDLRGRSNPADADEANKPAGYAGTRSPVDNGRLRGTPAPAEQAASTEPAGARVSTKDRPAGALTSNLRGTPNPATFHGPPQSTTTSQTEDHLHTAVTVSRASPPPRRLPRAARVVVEALGCDDDDAQAIADEIDRRHRPERLAGYLRTMAEAGDLADVLAEIQAARNAPPPTVIEPPCGECGPGRLVELDDGRAARCPTCHPRRQEAAA